MRLSIPQQTVFNSKKRFRVVITGRRFGKTALDIEEIGKFARHKCKRPRQIWYIAPFYGQAKEIVWSTLKEKLIENRWIKNSKSLNETALAATLRNGNVIKLKGANNPDSLRGSGVHFMILDEFQDIKEKAWLEVLRPMLSDTNGHALFTATPKGFSWSYRMFQRGQKNSTTYSPEWESFQYTTLQGGNVSQQEIEDARKDLDERTFRQEYEASFETYAGIVYYAFDHVQSIMPYKRPPVDGFKRLTLHIGMDFNVNPMCATVAVENALYTHIIDEIIIYSSNTHEMAEEIRSRYPVNQIFIYPDPACRQRRTSAGGNTDLKILQDSRYNLNVRVRSRHPLIRDRINSVNSMFKSASGDRRMYIDPKCSTGIRCLTNQLYKEGTMVPDKDTGFDHWNDALGYFAEYMHPVNLEMEVPFFNPMG